MTDDLAARVAWLEREMAKLRREIEQLKAGNAANDSGVRGASGG